MPAAGVQPAAAIGLSDRELSLIRSALRSLRVDFTGRRRDARLLGDRQQKAYWSAQILELDLLRVKLGDLTETRETEANSHVGTDE